MQSTYFIENLPRCYISHSFAPCLMNSSALRSQPTTWNISTFYLFAFWSLFNCVSCSFYFWLWTAFLWHEIEAILPIQNDLNQIETIGCGRRYLWLIKIKGTTLVDNNFGRQRFCKIEFMMGSKIVDVGDMNICWTFQMSRNCFLLPFFISVSFGCVLRINKCSWNAEHFLCICLTFSRVSHRRFQLSCFFLSSGFTLVECVYLCCPHFHILMISYVCLCPSYSRISFSLLCRHFLESERPKKEWWGVRVMEKMYAHK